MGIERGSDPRLTEEVPVAQTRAEIGARRAQAAERAAQAAQQDGDHRYAAEMWESAAQWDAWGQGRDVDHELDQ